MMDETANIKIKKKEIEQLLKDFDLKIKKCLNQTNSSEREDLSQEIKLKIIEKLLSIEFDDSPSFWELVDRVETKKK